MAVYKDIDLDLTPHPITGDVLTLKDVNAIKNSLINIIQGKPFEKPFDEYYGTTIRDLVFSNFSPMLEPLTERMIKEKVGQYDSRITILSVKLVNDPSADTPTNQDKNQLSLDIEYSIAGLQVQTTRINLERVR